MTNTEKTYQIKNELEHLRAELRKITHTSPEHESTLTALDTRIDEAIKDIDNTGTFESLKQNIDESVAIMQKEYPTLTQVMMGVSNMLSSIGI